MTDDSAWEARRRSIYDANFDSRHAVVEGVEIDLRHPNIDPDRWWAPMICAVEHSPGLVRARKPSYQEAFTPLIYCPWHSVCWSTLLSDYDSLTKLARARLLASYLPDDYLEAGDRMFISEAFLRRTGPTWAAPEDTEVMIAFLDIERSDGFRSPVLKPQVYTRRGRMHPSRGVNLRGVTQRLCSRMNLGSIHDLCVTVDGNLTLEEACLLGLQKVSDDRARVLDKIPREGSALFDSREIWVDELVRAALTAGYIMREIEEGDALIPAAERDLDAALARRKATAIAAVARRRQGEPKRDAARALMKRKPHLSFTACANAIAEGGDAAGVRRVIEPLFPKGPDGKRRYIGDDRAESPA